MHDQSNGSIERLGFADTPDSGQDADTRGDTWFSFEREMQNTAVKDRDWWVIVEVPDDVVAAHRYTYDGEPGPYQTRLPHEVVNRYRPFTFEQISPGATPARSADRCPRALDPSRARNRQYQQGFEPSTICSVETCMS